MAEHEVKEQDKSDELVDMIEKLMEMAAVISRFRKTISWARA
ncbi:MAG: hypothetical protein ACLSFT_05440 [Ruminococcus callidus]